MVRASPGRPRNIATLIGGNFGGQVGAGRASSPAPLASSSMHCSRVQHSEMDNSVASCLANYLCVFLIVLTLKERSETVGRRRYDDPAQCNPARLRWLPACIRKSPRS